MKKEEFDITQHLYFQKLWTESLVNFSNILPYFLRELRLYYILALLKLSKKFTWRVIYKEIYIRILRFLRYRRKGNGVGILVDYLDKGGMEQVIYNIASNLSRYKPYIFITGDNLGEKSWLLEQKGYYVYLLKDNLLFFKELVVRNNVRLINTHFSIWNLEEISNIGIPILYTIHNSYTWIEDPIAIKNISYAYRYVDYFIAVSSAVKNYFANRFNISLKKIFVIENGIGYKEFHRSPINRKNNRDFIFLNVGSFTPLKNQMLLISAFEKVSLENENVKLCLIGNNLDPQYANHIKKYVKKKKLSKKIQILPFVDKKELSLIYENSNCFVLSSLQEGAPNVLLESLYFGLPTISTNVGNASAILGKNGILVANSYERLEKLSLQSLVNLSYSVDQKNKKELAIAMCNMIEEYSSWLEKSEDMRKYILSKYSVENMVQSYEDMYQKYIK